VNGIYERIYKKAFGMEDDETDNGKNMRNNNGGRGIVGKKCVFSICESENSLIE